MKKNQAVLTYFVKYTFYCLTENFEPCKKFATSTSSIQYTKATQGMHR